MEEAVSERRKAFAAAYRSAEGRQAYISTSRHASPVIAVDKDAAWQATCLSLSLKSVYFLLRSVAGSSSSFSFFRNFPNCSFQGVGFGLCQLSEIPLFYSPAKDLA